MDEMHKCITEIREKEVFFFKKHMISSTIWNIAKKPVLMKPLLSTYLNSDSILPQEHGKSDKEV
jgi:hypothetical protein